MTKAHTTLTIDVQVLEAAKSAGINISQTLEAALANTLMMDKYKRKLKIPRKLLRKVLERVGEYPEAAEAMSKVIQERTGEFIAAKELVEMTL